MKYLLLLIALTTALFAGPIAGTSATFEVGKIVTLTVTADGTPPFTYDWRRDSWAPGDPPYRWTLDSHKSTCVLDTSTAFIGTHVYKCVVTNSAGAATSNEVTVTIIPHVPTPEEIEAERIRQLIVKEKAAAVALGYSYDEATRSFGAPARLTADQSKKLVTALGL